MIMLWTLRQSQLSKVFIDLVTEALMASGSHRNNISIGPHQGRKFAASLSKFYLKCSDEELALWMGCKTIKVLQKHYINEVPRVRFRCVVPMGIVSP